MKEEIKKILLETLKAELAKAKEVGESLNSFKQEGDMKAESKYDTRSIEAGYLSSAHQKRLMELERDLSFCEKMELAAFTSKDEVALSAILDLQIGEEKKRYFLSLVCGGLVLKQFEPPIHVISVHSPLGKELLGLKVGEEFEMEIKGKQNLCCLLALN